MIKHAFDHVTVTKVWFVGWIAWSHWLHIDWSMCDQCVINVWSMYDQWLPLVILDHSLITPTRWVSMGTWSGIDQCLIGLDQAIKALTLDQSSKKNTIKPWSSPDQPPTKQKKHNQASICRSSVNQGGLGWSSSLVDQYKISWPSWSLCSVAFTSHQPS